MAPSKIRATPTEMLPSLALDNVRNGSLADIGEGYQGCPLYP